MKKLCLLWALSLQVNYVISQSAQFRVEVDAKQIPLGSYVDVEFILENYEAKNFIPPSFKDFDVIAGPNRSSSMSIVNGKVTKKQSYSYSLQPKKTGEFKIGKASVQTSLGKMYSKEIYIKVLEASKQASSVSESVFVKTIVSDSIAHIGQQVILSYKLYTRLNVQSINFISKPEYEGFYAEEVGSRSDQTKREFIDGVEYATKIIKRMALFPQQKGAFEIPPVMVNLGIASENSRRSFFFSSQLERKQVMAEGAAIIVQDLPGGAPGSFSGAIGSYSMNLDLSKRNITTDDAIIIRMTITGDGDSKTVAPPIWIESDSLEVYDPNIISDEFLSRKRKLTHRKEFEYLLVPKHPGKYVLRPEFSYYNPDSLDYIRLTEQLPAINVVPGNRYSSNKNSGLNDRELQLIEDPSLKLIGAKIHGSLLHSLFLILTLVSALGILLYSSYLNKSGKRDPIQIKRNKAHELAVRRLEQLSGLLKAQKRSEFYLELARVVKQFVSDKFQIAGFHISNSEIITSLQQHGLSESDLNDFDKILKSTETAIYAPGLAGDPDILYNQTLSLFTRLES